MHCLRLRACYLVKWLVETLDWILLAHAVEREVLAGSKEGCVNYPPHFYRSPSLVNIVIANTLLERLAQAVLLVRRCDTALTSTKQKQRKELARIHSLLIGI